MRLPAGDSISPLTYETRPQPQSDCYAWVHVSPFRSPKLNMPKDGQAALAQAEQHLAEQQWAEALAAAHRLIEAACSEPDLLARAWLLSARAAWHLADLDACFGAAMQALTRAREAQQPATQISALTLAAFVLAELNSAEQALPLATEALLLAEAAELFMLRPVALSCASHVHARLRDLPVAEALHMEALSMARESGAPEHLQMAYDNLTLSLSFARRAARERHDDTLARVAELYARKHIPQISSLLRDERIDDWRRVNLMHNLAELHSLSGDPFKAEVLLDEAQQVARALPSEQDVLTAQLLQAELQIQRGAWQAAFELLSPAVATPAFAQVWYQRQLKALSQLLACCNALGLQAQAELLLSRIQQCTQTLSALRARVLSQLLPMN